MKILRVLLLTLAFGVASINAAAGPSFGFGFFHHLYEDQPHCGNGRVLQGD